MTLEILKAKDELRSLIDAYATLGDEKRFSEVMNLFTTNLTYSVYIGNQLVSTLSGKDDMEKNFILHGGEVKTYFTLNGQHVVNIDGDKADGISFSQLKMIREIEGKDILTEYSVRYEDKYVFSNDKWLIGERVGYFIIVETRPLI
ncbi:MAG: nuclear transport factor 2 family protein [Pedobacter sp.]|nr:MAG: nuclear transport factor 2 family protein [Pedobacter sp.]